MKFIQVHREKMPERKKKCLLQVFILWGENIHVGLMWRWKNSLGGQFSFHHVSPSYKHLYQPGHLTGPRKDLKKKNSLYLKKDKEKKQTKTPLEAR